MNLGAFKAFITYPLHVMVRPFSSFTDIKEGSKGSKKMIIVAIFMTWFAITFNGQYASIVVNTTDPLTLNSIRDLYGVATVFLLWCVGNWSITSLMDGEGKLVQIATGTAYALTPYYLGTIIAVIASRFMTVQESAFYFMIISVVTVWAAFLVFSAVVIIHNYTVFKALATIFLSFVAMLIIIFLVLMISALLQQVYSFGYNIYLELLYRV